MIKGGVFFALLILSLVSIAADPIIYSNCSIFGTCQPQVSKGGGSQNITIFNNNSYFNITGNNSEPNWQSNFSLYGFPLSLDQILNPAASKTFTLGGNTLTWRFTNPVGGMLWNFTGGASGHLLEINQNGNVPDGNEVHLLHFNATDTKAMAIYIAGPANPNEGYLGIGTSDGLFDVFLINKSGLYENGFGNFTGSIYSSGINLTALNSTGLIKDWNQTGYIRDWSYLINGLLSQSTADTLYYPKYNNIANYYNSSNFNITSFYNSSNPSNFYNSSNFNISTFYNASNPFNFWNDSKIYNGTLCQSNGTGCPASSGITNGSSAWLNNLSLSGDFLINRSSTSNSFFMNSTVFNFSSFNQTNFGYFISNINSYSQVWFQNINSGTNVSQDLVITSSNGTNANNYLDLGINGQNYNDTLAYGNVYNATGPNDGYLYVQDGKLVIGTATPGRDLLFTAGGMNIPNIEMMISGTNGNVGIGTTNPQNTLNVNGDTNLSGNLFINNNPSILGINSSYLTFQPLNYVNVTVNSIINQNVSFLQLKSSRTDIRGGNIMAIMMNDSFGSGLQNNIVFGALPKISNFSSAPKASFSLGIVSIFSNQSSTALNVSELSPFENTRLAIFQGGRVGINTSSPANTLSVVGTTNLAGSSGTTILIVNDTNAETLSGLQFKATTLPTCAAGIFGTLQRNVTGMYYCNATGWMAEPFMRG